MNREFEIIPHIAKLIDESGAFYCKSGDWYLCDDREIENLLDEEYEKFKKENTA